MLKEQVFPLFEAAGRMHLALKGNKLDSVCKLQLPLASMAHAVPLLLLFVVQLAPLEAESTRLCAAMCHVCLLNRRAAAAAGAWAPVGGGV